jgi:hypothetical protein
LLQALLALLGSALLDHCQISQCLNPACVHAPRAQLQHNGHDNAGDQAMHKNDVNQKSCRLKDADDEQRQCGKNCCK